MHIFNNFGQVVKEKNLFKEIVDAQTHGRTMDDGQRAITKAYPQDIVIRWAKNSYRISTSSPQDPFIMAGRINSWLVLSTASNFMPNLKRFLLGPAGC